MKRRPQTDVEQILGARRRRRMRDELGDLAGGVYTWIYNLTPRERRAAIRALDKLTGRNCGWYLYEMRHVLRDFIAMATPRRRRKEKRKA